MVPNVVLTFYYHEVFCKKEEISCIHEYTASDGYFFMKLRVTSLLRRCLFSKVRCICMYDSYNLQKGLFGSYGARLGTIL